MLDPDMILTHIFFERNTSVNKVLSSHLSGHSEFMMLEEMTRDSLSSDGVLSQRENLKENLISRHTEDDHYSRPKGRTRLLRLWALLAAALVTSNIITAALCYTYLKHGNYLLKWTNSYCKCCPQP